MNRARRVVIVGGGITGIATAHALLRAASAAEIEVTLLEASGRLGGNIRTEHENDFTLDAGPDSWVTSKPHATALAKEIGLGADLVSTIPETRKVYIAWSDGLHVLPEGLVLGVPTQVMPMASTGLFTWDAKVRMALEPILPPRPLGPDDDESIGDFVTRRLGDQVAERLVAPLLGGIYGGDAFTISLRATFPQFLEAERAHGSLIRAMRALGKPASAHDRVDPGRAHLCRFAAASVDSSIRSSASSRASP